MMMAREHTILIADSGVHELPTSEDLAAVSCGAAAYARKLGQEHVSRSSLSLTLGNQSVNKWNELEEL